MVTDQLIELMLVCRIITLECQLRLKFNGLLHNKNGHRTYCYGYYQPLATPLFVSTHIHPTFDVMIDVATYYNMPTPSPVER